MSRADRIIVNASEVVTCAGFSEAPARAADQAALGVQRGAAVAMGDGRVLAVDDEKSIRERFRVADDRTVDARCGVVLPGFVDPHTHLVFGGDRALEWEQRMQGKPYLDILRDGGGILSTVRKTREAPAEVLTEHAIEWVARSLAHGTTTLEAKSGYCLTRDGELKLLEVARAVSDAAPQRIVSTYLGAHVVPPELADRRHEYVELVCSMMEEIAERRLADFVDVFCEVEAFTVDETERVLTRARDLGFALKLHAEQFTSSGATRLGARLGAASVDHLEHVTADDIRALASASRPPVGVLLPAVPFHLGMSDFAPARDLIDGNVPVALATDFNPGSSFTPSVPMIIALACRTLGMSVAEAIVAATINAAHALGLGREVGSIEAGKRADVIVCEVPDHRWLGYAFGWNPVDTVIVGGEVIS